MDKNINSNKLNVLIVLLTISVICLFFAMYKAGCLSYFIKEIEVYKAIENVKENISDPNVLSEEGKLALIKELNTILPKTKGLCKEESYVSYINSIIEKMPDYKDYILRDTVKISAGFDHSLALDEYGNVWAWGNNDYGQVGIADLGVIVSPTKVEGLNGKKIVDIEAGGKVSYAINSDGELYAWGNNTNWLVDPNNTSNVIPTPKMINTNGKKVDKVKASWRHAMYISDAEVYTWGDGGNGKLGHGNRTSEFYPKKIQELPSIKDIETSSNGAHNIALSTNGEVYTWGVNKHGQLGNSSFMSSSKPYKLELPKVRKIAVGGRHSLVVSDENVYVWGSNTEKQLGIDFVKVNAPTPLEIDHLAELKHDDIMKVSSNGNYNALLKKNGEFIIWGDGNYSDILQTENNDLKFKDISVGYGHILALDYTGNLYCWGYNEFGQLGIGTTIDSGEPNLVHVHKNTN